MHNKEEFLSDPNMRAAAAHLLNLTNLKSSKAIARRATDRAITEVMKFMETHALFDEFLHSVKSEHVLRMKILEISKRYIKEKHVQHSSLNDIDKQELERLAKSYEKLILDLESLSPASRVYFATAFYENDLKPYDFFSETKNKLSSDWQIIRSLVSKKRGRGSLEIPHVKGAAEAAALLFTQCSSRRFKKNIRTTRKGGQEFIELDSLFVETLLKAMDPEITFANVRTALKAVPVD
ncbi:hypothetical protein BLJAPNOD_00852 [Ensifer sp. M14]|uniref:hypothetical protein n=1 Tax=Ensifer sp. M14 TaxID=2203782 RepID=UPI000E2CA45D|nr:hypothetical protein [Ensifer sp. M14]RDL49744.1 hypothetical protein BLJAPNOD_00852 [Ensifer sp. M14]